MVEETLRLLILHLAWKATRLNPESENEGTVENREALEEQRTLVLEKLVELVVASDCNPTEGVKRAVSTCRVFIQQELNMSVIGFP
jgi:hypothetical protein